MMKRFVLTALIISAFLVAAPLEGFAEGHDRESERDKYQEKMSTSTVVEDDREHYRDSVEESLDVSRSYVVFQWPVSVASEEEERVYPSKDRD